MDFKPTAASLAAHGGIPRKPFLRGKEVPGGWNPNATPQNAHITPLFQTTVFDYNSISSEQQLVAGENGYGYGRDGLPNRHELGAAVAALEGAEAGVACSTGMGAISAALLATLSCGDLLIAQKDLYGGTIDFLKNDLPRFGITVRFEDTNNLEHLEKLLVMPAGTSSFEIETASNGHHKENGDKGVGDKTGKTGTKEGTQQATNGQHAANMQANGRSQKTVVLIETVSNPLLVVSDVQAVAALSKKTGALLFVDNTFGTPLRSQPLSEGADLVIHSATKFLGGHHDLLAGAVVGRSELVSPIADIVKRMGLIAPAFDSWLAVRGIRTLQVRMERSWASAAFLGRQLEKDSRIKSVIWHDKVALVTFVVLGGFREADALVEAFRLITYSTTLGGVTSTISHPATASHAPLPAEERAKLGISDGLLRLSVGLEDPKDLWADLDRGLTAAAAVLGKDARK